VWEKDARLADTPAMPRVQFDVITKGYEYPLSREEVLHVLSWAEEVAPGLPQLVRSVRFGCNHRTTQEGRVVQRGESFEVRVNFCPKDNRTRILRSSRSWLLHAKKCGGVPDLESGAVTWSRDSARRYAVFLLLHELAHVVYMRRIGSREFDEKSGGESEERFCDDWAEAALKRWTYRSPSNAE